MLNNLLHGGNEYDHLMSTRIFTFNKMLYISSRNCEESGYNLGLDLLSMFHILGEVGLLE